MKKTAIYISLILSVFSCQKQEPGQMSLSLAISGEDATKVTLDEDLRTCWNKGDKATVFYRGSSATEWLYEGQDGAHEGSLKYIGTPIKDAGAATYAIYPANSSATLSGSTVSLNLPSSQYLDAGRNMAPVLVAATSSSDLVFGYATALVGVSIEGYGQVKDIVLKGNAEETLCGAATIDMSSDVPYVLLSSSASGKEIVLKTEDDAPLADITGESRKFYFSVPPMTFNEGFTVRINYTRGGSQTVKYTDAVVLEASQVLMLDNIRTNDEFVLELDFNQGYGVGKSNVAAALADFKNDYGVTLPSAGGTASAVYDMNISGQTYRFELGYCKGVDPVGYFYVSASDSIEPSLAISTNGWYMKLPKVADHVLTGFSNVAGRTITTVSSTEYFITTDVSVSRSDARSKCVSGKLMAPQTMGEEYRTYIVAPSEQEDYYICLYAGGWLYMQNLKLYYTKIR